MTSALAPMLFHEPTSNSPLNSNVPFVNAVPKSGILLNPYPPNHHHHVSPTTSTTNAAATLSAGGGPTFGRSPRFHAATLPTSSEDASLSSPSNGNNNTLSPSSAVGGGGGNGRWSAKSSPLAKSVTLPLSRNDSSSSSKSDLNNNSNSNNGSHSRANSMRKIRFAPLPDPRKLEELELVMDSPLGLIPTSLAVSAFSSSPSKSNGLLSSGEEAALRASPRPASAVMDQDPATPASNVSQFSSVSASTANTVDSSATAPATMGGGGGAPSVASTDDGRAETDTDSRHRKSKSWGKRLFRPLLLKSTSSSAPSTPNPANASHQGYSSDGLWRTTSRDSVTSNTSNDSGAFGLSRSRTSTGFADRFASMTPLARAQSLGTPTPTTKPQPKKKPGHAASSSLGGGGGGARRSQQRMLNGRVYGYRQSNPFANVQDQEPEFVEWGHGGAGSVRSNNSTGSSMYAGVQSAGRVSIGHSGQGSNNGGGAVVEDEDDGSGMAWLRKRRAERERREKEAAEAKAKEDAAKTDANLAGGDHVKATDENTSAGDKQGTGMDDSSETKVQEEIELDRPSDPTAAVVPSAVAEPSSSSATTVPEEEQQHSPAASYERANGVGSMTPIMEVDVASPASSKDGAGTPMMMPPATEEEHYVTAVTVPVSHHHHHHHHHHKHGDGDVTTTTTTTTTTTETATPATATAMPKGGMVVPDSNASTASSSSSMSSSSRGGEGDGESDETEEEDATESGTSEEEDEEDEDTGEDTEGESRVTSRCAGVEKVSRHKE